MDRNKFRVGNIFLVILIALNLSFIKFVQAQDELVPIIDKLNSLEKDIRDVQRKMNTKNISIEPSSNITTEQTIPYLLFSYKYLRIDLVSDACRRSTDHNHLFYDAYKLALQGAEAPESVPLAMFQ